MRFVIARKHGRRYYRAFDPAHPVRNPVARHLGCERDSPACGQWYSLILSGLSARKKEGRDYSFLVAKGLLKNAVSIGAVEVSPAGEIGPIDYGHRKCGSREEPLQMRMVAV